MTTESAVLLMAYGTPDRVEDVPEYFTHIRGGRRPSDEAIADLQSRYLRIGGTTPLRRISETVRDRLEATLAAETPPGEAPYGVYLGMKHWHPYIEESLRVMRDAGIRRVIALALAPHYSRMSVGAYRHAVEAAQAALGNPFDVIFVDRWHDRPGFTDLIATRVTAALSKLDDSKRRNAKVVFTAHSLPVRIREWGDPYEQELRESSANVAARLGIDDWRFAWQSAGGSTEPWIGPDILNYLESLAAEGVETVVQVPIGFVSDHLEILYDVDIEAVQRARALGIHLVRTDMLNAEPDFIRLLASVVTQAGAVAVA